MAIKDNASSGSKDELMKDLKSLKSALDEDDDNVPLLLEDDDIPVLSDDDGDIPILDAPEFSDDANDKASLEAALRQLESMELAPKSRKAVMPPARGIEDQIRANAAAPIISNEELTRVRENPFLNSNQKAQLDANRKLREEAQQAAKTVASGQKPAAPQKSAPMQEEIIEFTDNPFLKASTSPGSAHTAASAATHTPLVEEEDGSAEILKELGEDARPYQPRVPAKAPVMAKQVAATDETTVDGLGDIILEDEEPAPARKPDPAAAGQKKLQKKEIDLIVDEVVDEYIVILEAALRKKLKEKLPDLLK